MQEWFREFFATLPDAFRALYHFGDPQGLGRGWLGVFITLVWAGLLIALPLYVAKITYGKREWVSATMGVIAGLSIFWWVYGILPSAWVYYLDANKAILEGPIIPASIGITLQDGYRIDIASNLYGVIRDTVVVLQHAVAFGLTFWAALRIQKKYPRTLVAGETKPESGGYK